MNKCTVDINKLNHISMLSAPEFFGEEDVFLRELLQNAMDACKTREALEYSWGTEFLELESKKAFNSMKKPFESKISISYNSLTQRLSVEDNGIGMNENDVMCYLSQIGKSFYTSEDFTLQQLNYEPIGHFGVGLLSCFMVARALLFESKKDKCVNTAWNLENKESLEPITAKWFEGTGEMEYVRSNRTESGTKVTLVLKPKYAMRVSLQELVRGVSKYMLYQPFPIEVSFDEKKVVVANPNPILDNPFADVLGIVSIRIEDELMEGYIWLYPSKFKPIMGKSLLYQQGFLIEDNADDLGIKPEWIRDLTFHLHLKRQFLSLRMTRDGVAKDEYLKDLRCLFGQKIVEYFSPNPIGMNQYLSRGEQPVIPEYEQEIALLGNAITLEVFLKGREVTLPIETIINGFHGKVIRIAFIKRECFRYFQKTDFMHFRDFLKENKLVVFERNRDIFCQFLAPYVKSQSYVIGECPGVMYEDMIADFQMIKSPIPYRNKFHLLPQDFGENDIFCMVINHQKDSLELMINKEHRLYKMLAPVWYVPKVHNMVSVILENIKQRIINSQKNWDKIVDFGGEFLDDWNVENVASLQAIGCLEQDFVESVNAFIDSRLTRQERANLGLQELEFSREDFIDWWFTTRLE